METQKKYLKVEYPKTNRKYISLLCYELAVCFFWGVEAVFKKKQDRLRMLDLGSGLGLHAEAFDYLGINVRCVDSEYDFEKDKLPHKTNYFDCIFSKSTLEHISNTQHILSEAYRVLKPLGEIVCMIPDYRKDFWDDSTHIRPFTQWGLKQAFLLAGFRDVNVELFYQLPFVWRHPWLKFIPKIISILPLPKWKDRDKGIQNVLIRHSKEPVILLSARK